MKLLSVSAAIFAIASFVQAQSNPSSCDPNTCKLPNCLCPSQSPPAGLNPKDVPQFVTITFDDSIQPQLLATAKDLLNVKQVYHLLIIYNLFFLTYIFLSFFFKKKKT